MSDQIPEVPECISYSFIEEMNGSAKKEEMNDKSKFAEILPFQCEVEVLNTIREETEIKDENAENLYPELIIPLLSVDISDSRRPSVSGVPFTSEMSAIEKKIEHLESVCSRIEAIRKRPLLNLRFKIKLLKEEYDLTFNYINQSQNGCAQEDNDLKVLKSQFLNISSMLSLVRKEDTFDISITSLKSNDSSTRADYLLNDTEIHRILRGSSMF